MHTFGWTSSWILMECYFGGSANFLGKIFRFSLTQLVPMILTFISRISSVHNSLGLGRSAQNLTFLELFSVMAKVHIWAGFLKVLK